MATCRKAHHHNVFTVQAALCPIAQDANRALCIGQRRIGAFVMPVVGQAIGHDRQGVAHGGKEGRQRAAFTIDHYTLIATARCDQQGNPV